jgi:CubicO group peptidase (beta-lactamase class C family)
VAGSSSGCSDDPVDRANVERIAAELRANGAGPGAPRGDAFRAFLRRELENTGTPGLSVAVVDGGELVWAEGFGVTSVETGEVVTSATLFQAASVSKPIAATAMLRMVDEGLLRLDEPIERYLDSWALPPGRQTPDRPVVFT